MWALLVGGVLGGTVEVTRGPLRPLRGHLPLKGEDIVVLTVLPLQGEVARRAGGGPRPGGWGAPENDDALQERRARRLRTGGGWGQFSEEDSGVPPTAVPYWVLAEVSTRVMPARETLTV